MLGLKIYTATARFSGVFPMAKNPLILPNTYVFPYCLFSFFQGEDANRVVQVLVCFSFGLEAFKEIIPASIATYHFSIEFENNIFHIPSYSSHGL